MATFTLVVVGVWFCEVLLQCERYECQLGIWIERDIYEITHTCLKIKLNCIMTKLAIVGLYSVFERVSDYLKSE